MIYTIDSDDTRNERHECDVDAPCSQIKNIGSRNLRLTFNHFTEAYLRPGESVPVPAHAKMPVPGHLLIEVVDQIVPPFDSTEPRPTWAGEHGKQP